MKYKAILFDADGVTLKDGQRFSAVFSEKYHVPMEIMTPFFTNEFQACLVGKADLKQELAKVISAWKWQGTIEELMALWFATGCELDDEIVSIIRQLQKENIATYLVTNQEKYRGEYLRNKLKGLFNDVFISGEIGCKKDDAAFFEKVYKKIGDGIQRSDILLIDDDIENIETARRFGFDVLHYRNSIESIRSKINN